LFGRRDELGALRRAYNELGTSHQDLLRLFTSARRRCEELRGDRDAYRAEADHYRRLTSELDARLENLAAVRSEFQAMVSKLESI
jgi:hypothetical protein